MALVVAGFFFQVSIYSTHFLLAVVISIHTERSIDLTSQDMKLRTNLILNLKGLQEFNTMSITSVITVLVVTSQF